MTVRYVAPTVLAMTPGREVRLALRMPSPTPEVRLTFEGRPGQSLAVYAETFRLFRGRRLVTAPVEVVRPDGSLRETVRFEPTDSFVRTGPLDARGSWTLRFAADGLTGDLALTPYLGTAHTGELLADEDVTATFVNPADSYTWTVTVPAGREVSLLARDATLAAHPPAGSRLTTTGILGASVDSDADPAHYSYTEILSGTAARVLTPDALTSPEGTVVTLTLTSRPFTSGSVVVHHEQWTPPPAGVLELGSPTTVTLAHPRQVAQYTFTVVTEGRYVFTATGVTLDGSRTVGVTASLGTMQLGNRFSPLLDGADVTTHRRLDPGTWTLTLRGLDDTVGTLTLTVRQDPD